MGKILFPFCTFTERYLSPSTEHFGVIPSDDGVAVCLVADYLCAVLCVSSERHRGSGMEKGALWETNTRREDAVSPTLLSARMCWQWRDDLHVGDPGKFISLCRGLRTSFSKKCSLDIPLGAISVFSVDAV